MKSEAWFLYAGNRGSDEDCGLVRETFELSSPGTTEVIAEPIYGGWEAAMTHALQRKPIDVCAQRHEERVILGNAGVVRVVECGTAVRSVEPGQYAMICSACDVDRYGYPTKILGFDAPNVMGCLATRIKISEQNLVGLAKASAESLPRWAAASVRYMAAWSNWSLAFAVYRLLVPEAADPKPNVWAWGGGTALGELDLARRFGCNAVMLGGSDLRLDTIRRTGVEALDRRAFGNLSFDEGRASADERRAYADAERRFLQAVDERTGGRRVQIFVDNVGTPVFRATSRALSREGIIATTGWKEGMQIAYLRARACVERQQHINTHYARRAEVLEAVRFADANDWRPVLDTRVYSFDEVPVLANDYANGLVGLFPVYQVNPP